jgi:hypothetical protein
MARVLCLALCVGLVAATASATGSLARRSHGNGRPAHEDLMDIETTLTKMLVRVEEEGENVTKRHVKLTIAAREAADRRLGELNNFTITSLNKKLEAQGSLDVLTLRLEGNQRAQDALDERKAGLDGRIEAARQQVKEEALASADDLGVARESSEKLRDGTQHRLVDEIKTIATMKELLEQFKVTKKPGTYKQIRLTDAKGAPSKPATGGFGGGFDPTLNGGTFVFPKYGKTSPVQALLYDGTDGRAQGTQMMGSEKLGGLIIQMWFDTSGAYYVANFDTGFVKKSMGGKIVWTFELPGGACVGSWEVGGVGGEG